jgi:acyl-CoA thioester hydrolase
MTRRHSIRVRYGECDMQGVVFNAHYLAYCDDAVDTWFRTAVPDGMESVGYDVMLVKAVIEWHRPARLMDLIEMELHISRRGRTSFDVTVAGTVGDLATFSAVITYVGVVHGTTEPVSPPDSVVAALGR